MAIPQSALGSDRLSEAQSYFYMMADNILAYDDSKITPQEISYGFKVISNNGLKDYLISLIELRKALKEEAWDLANMNDYRYGNIRPDAGKGVTEQSIYRAKLGSVLMITMYNKALERDHQADLEYAKYAYAEGAYGSIMGDNGEPEFVSIDGNKLCMSELGVFVKNSQVEKEKLDRFKELAFGALQSGDYDVAAEAIDQDNSKALKKIINEFVESKRQFESQMAERAEQARLQEAQIKSQDSQADRDASLNEIVTKEQMITDRELALRAIDNAAETGQNVDAEIKRQQTLIKERELALKERQQSETERQNKETNRIKEKQIDTQLKVAKTNKN